MYKFEMETYKHVIYSISSLKKLEIVDQPVLTIRLENFNQKYLLMFQLTNISFPAV